jgi:predicted HTH domain antitoxin
METLAIPIPENFLEAVQMDKNTMIEAMRSEFAGKLFREGALSLEQGAEFCGITIYEFLDVLSAAGIPVINYAPKELEEEIAGYLKHDNRGFPKTEVLGKQP